MNLPFLLLLPLLRAAADNDSSISPREDPPTIAPGVSPAAWGEAVPVPVPGTRPRPRLEVAEPHASAGPGPAYTAKSSTDASRHSTISASTLKVGKLFSYQKNTYQNTSKTSRGNISIDSSYVSKFMKMCNFSACDSKINFSLFSQTSSTPVPHNSRSAQNENKTDFIILSQVKYGDRNSSAAEIRNSSFQVPREAEADQGVGGSGRGAPEGRIKSSLGSVDVLVPSLRGMEVPSRPPEPVEAGSGRNRTLQRLGRTDAPMLNYIFDSYSTLNKHLHWNDRFGGPRIESPGSSVAVDTDAEAQLDCKVAALQDKLVSWVRRKPEDDSLEILTIGPQTFTADLRFSVEFLVPETWRLRLQGARAKDSGSYECQLSTHPPLISRHQLLVHPPTVELVEVGGSAGGAGGVRRDQYYERNSTLALGCRVRHLHLPQPGGALLWRHRDRSLNDDTERGGVSVKTEASEGGVESTLLVARLTASDSGLYTCSVRDPAPAPAPTLTASVNVHVLNGESLAELHQGSGSGRSAPWPLLPALLFCLFSVTLWSTLPACLSSVALWHLLPPLLNNFPLTVTPLSAEPPPVLPVPR